MYRDVPLRVIRVYTCHCLVCIIICIVYYYLDCKRNTWLVGVIFAKKEDGNNLHWKWNPNKEYAECYNLAETEIEIKIRTKRSAPDEFSISTDTHDILRTLDGYDDSGE